MTQRTTQNSRRAAGIEDPFILISGISTPTIQTPPHLITPTMMSRDPSKSAHIDPMDDDTNFRFHHPGSGSKHIRQSHQYDYRQRLGFQTQTSGTRPFRWFRLLKTPHFYPTVQIELLRLPGYVQN